MFTGIVETTGRIHAVESDPDGRRLRIESPKVSAPLDAGQSVAINGACLTVESSTDDTFTVFLSAETIERTALSTLALGDAVNLERAMPADGRFDGHLVQGHVDTTTTVTGIDRVGEDWTYSFDLPPGYERYVVEKGSIAIDGISLTVADRTAETFSVAIIPTTYEHTTLSDRSPGDPVQLEVDIVAKYVESLLPTE